MLGETRLHSFDFGENKRSALPDKNPKSEFNCSRNHNVSRVRHASSPRSSFLGIEMKTELVWDNWNLGKVFTKTLIIRNTQSKLQRVLFRPPLTKYFTSLARQKLVLGPGASFSIPFTFKPVKRRDYEDSVEFQGKDDSFQVLLRASAQCHAIEVPESVLLPLCAVQRSTRTTFMLKNVSMQTTFFHWESAPPFTLSPEQGHVKPGQEQTITVTFLSQHALVFQQPATCNFGTQADKLESCCKVLLHGLAKHPYLAFKSSKFIQGRDHVPVLDFGCAAVGQTLHSRFEISNPSLVPALFTLSRLPGAVPLSGSVFDFDVTEAEIAPGESLKAKASFTPAAADTTSVQYLSIICRGAVNQSLLKLIGRCKGPQVLLSSSVVDFGKVEPGQAVAHTVRLDNTSQAKAVFQWDIDSRGHSVFSIQPAEGTVPPQSHMTLNVSYRPTQPIVHYRRVACVILHGEPVFLDLVGNWHSEKPVKELLLGTSNIRESDQQSDVASHEAKTPMAEYFLSCLGDKDPLSSSPRQISISPNELIFDQKVLSLPEDLTSQKFMTVASLSKVKLRLEWTPPTDSCFFVSPLFCELPALKTTAFRVAYCPKQINALHGAQLECFVYPMDNDGINDSVLPTCVTVRAIGHSFEPGKRPKVPQCSLQPHLVEFTPVQTASYCTAHLKNTGDLPLTFRLNPGHGQELAEAASLVVVPSCGLIEPHSHQILSLRSVPTEDSPKEGFHIKLDLNGSEQAQKLTILSQSERPLVSLEDDGRLHFSPTAVHSFTQRLHQTRNLSRQALRFQWRIPEQDQGLISVEPDAGVLHPNEILTQMWSFTPLEEKTYTLTPVLTICPLEFPELDNMLLPLEVTGTGCTGCIQAKEAVFTLPDVLVGECRTVNIPVMNPSPCSVSFCVTVEQKVQNNGTVYDPSDCCALQVHNSRVTIASECSIYLQSTFTPPEKAQYMWTLSYQTIHANGSFSEAEVLCEVYAKGVFPTLQITDVCGKGSMSDLRKKHLWTLLTLDDLNRSLQSSPGPIELTFKTPTRHSLYPTPSVFTKTIMDLNFSGAPLNSDPSTFMLMLYNPGTVPVEWAFLFPEDQQLDVEFWAESGEFTSAELHQMKVQDNHLFSVTPRFGNLQGGEQRAVTFTHSHDFAGTDRFPVLLKISYGREIMLIFHGVTVEVDRPFVNFASETHVFASVAIGDYNPPKQVSHFYNQGAVPVHYEVDKAVLSQVREENFDHPVLRCLNPEGDVPPGQAAILDWVFSPLEAKLYQIDIPIHILNGDSTVVRFEGCGLNCKMQPLSDTCNVTDVQLLPCHQRQPFQPTFLSEDSVDFGDIVVSSQSSKMLFLINNSAKGALSFEWVLPRLNDQTQVLDINPSKGRLTPGETTHFVLTLSAPDYPTVYRSDLVCKVTSEAALSRYHSAVQQMEEENERKANEFIITDKTLKEDKVVLTEKEAESVALRQQSFWNKYKTLPPIRSSNDCNTVQSLCTKVSRAEQRTLREMEKAKAQSIKPPKPSLLHLWVSAQSHGPLVFLTKAPELLQRQYRPNKTERNQSQVILTEESPTQQGLKRDIISHVFTSLLRDLLKDEIFVDNLLTLASKPATSNLPGVPTPGPCPEAASSDEATEPHGAAGGCEDVPVEAGPDRAELQDLVEEVCRCTLQNLMVEVMRGDLDLTDASLLQESETR